MYAAECARAGYSGRRVVEAARTAAAGTLVFGLVPDLTAAVRGGRVKPVLKRVADLFGVSLVLKLSKGRVVPAGFVKQTRNPARALAGYLKRRIEFGKTYRIAIGYAKDSELAAELETAIRDVVPSIESLYRVELGAALGAHGGAGLVGIAAQEYVRP